MSVDHPPPPRPRESVAPNSNAARPFTSASAWGYDVARRLDVLSEQLQRVTEGLVGLAVHVERLIERLDATNRGVEAMFRAKQWPFYTAVIRRELDVASNGSGIDMQLANQCHQMLIDSGFDAAHIEDIMRSSAGRRLADAISQPAATEEVERNLRGIRVERNNGTHGTVRESVPGEADAGNPAGSS